MADRGEFERRLLGQVDTIAAIGRAMRPRDRYDVDDLVQEVLLRAWANRDALRDPAKLPQWVAIIARNAARELGRRLEPTPVGFLPDAPSGEPSALESMQTVERWDALLHALDALDDTERRLLIARYADEASYADLQTEAGLSYAAMTTRVHRAKRRVRRALAQGAASALALFVVARPRAFGQTPATMGGSRTMLSIIAVASAVFIAGVGLNGYRDTFGAPDGQDDAIAATIAAATVVAADTTVPQDAAKTLAAISEGAREYEAALNSYSASFTMRKVYHPSRLRARSILLMAEESMSRGVKLPPQYLDGLRAEIDDPSTGRREEATRGAFWEDGHVQAAEWTEGFYAGDSPSWTETRRSAITNDEHAVETNYTSAGTVTHTIGRGGRFRAEEFRLKRWSSFIGTPIAGFLAGETGALLSVAIADEVVEGEACYRIRAVRPHPGGAPDETDTIELLINAERGYLPLEILKEGPGTRTVTRAEIELHESGIWMPVGGRSYMYMKVDGEEELSAETSVQFFDIQRNVAIPETFVSLPPPGSEERERVLRPPE